MMIYLYLHFDVRFRFIQTFVHYLDAPPPELIHRRQPTIGFSSNMNFLIVLVITSVTGITFLLTSLYLCYKNRTYKLKLMKFDQ